MTSSGIRGAGILLALVLFMVGLGVGLHLRADSSDDSVRDSSDSAQSVSGTDFSSADTTNTGLGFGTTPQVGFANVAERVAPAVVNVSSVRTVVSRERVFSPFGNDPFFDFFGPRYFSIPRQRRESSLGSGVVVDSGGIVLTNNHVVEGAEQIQVILADGRRLDAELLGTDPATDVAVLRVKADSLPTVPLGNSDQSRIGEVVLAFGNPFGLGQTVTMGIISATGRSELGLVDYENFIQTDAAINPGNSGGALIDVQGRLIGINTAIFSRSGGYQGIGFAVPINIAQNVMQSILSTGKITRGSIGLSYQDIDEAMAEAFGLSDVRGAVVSEVSPGEPADRAGLRRGDVVVEFDGKPVNDAVDLRRSVALTPVGKTVRIGFLRSGSRQDLDVTVAEHETRFTYRSSGSEAGSSTLEGVVVEELDRRMAERLGLRQGASGVIVKEILAGSPAERSGLRAGDVILEMNRAAITGVDDFRSLLSKNEGHPVVLLLSRGRALYYLSLPS